MGFFRGKKAIPATQTQESGYGVLPQWAKDLYEKQYAPGINEYFSSDQSNNANPIAPFNELQQNALNQYGNQTAEGLENQIKPFMDLYDKYITNDINRNFDIQRNNIINNASQSKNLVGNYNSLPFVAELAGERQRALADSRQQNFFNALGLNQQSLSNMMNAGNIRQEQTQNELSSGAQGNLNRLQNLGQLLGMIPQSSVGTYNAGRPAGPSGFERLVGGINTAGGLFSGLGGLASGIGGLGNMVGSGLSGFGRQYINTSGGLPWKRGF